MTNRLPNDDDSILNQLFDTVTERNASDLHLAAGETPYIRLNGEMLALDRVILTDDQVLEITKQIAGESGINRLEERGSCDGAVSTSDHVRFRFNVYRCSDRLSIAFRRLDDQFRTLDQLGLPDRLSRLSELRDGLVLVAGPTGSGKSTTLATLINHINEQRSAHIITIEDPIEYLHPNRKSLVSQRQVGTDTDSFSNALVDAVRQDPDVILVGELRDLATIRTAVMAAETGHLVFATVHAGDCIGAIERLLSVFPGDEQAMIRNLVAGSLRAVVAQHLLPVNTNVNEMLVARAKPSNDQTGAGELSSKRGRVLASEVLFVNNAASNLIASDNLSQIQTILETNRNEGMYTLDSCLAGLWRAGKISELTAKAIARNPNMLRELSRAV